MDGWTQRYRPGSSSGYVTWVIESLRVRGLRALCRQDRSVGVAQHHVAKQERILPALDRSSGPEGMDLPGFVSIHSRDSGRAFTRSRFRVIGGSFFDSSTSMRSTSVMWTIAEGGLQ